MTMLWLCVLAVTLTWTQCSAREKCYAELGCFDTGGDFFHLIRRPLLLLPDDREVINTTYLLYTKENPKVPQYLNSAKKDSVTKSNFKITRPTKFITHGFMDNQYFGRWMQVLKDELLAHYDYNVVIVDWSGGNGLPYAQATVNSRVVGAELALFLSKLQEWVKLPLDTVHLIGHSLGAHISGYAGKRVSGIPRITALDPAEPYFQGLPATVRVDMTDAKFVDVIHTDGTTIFLLGFGMSDPVGHVDFYPNEGKTQPGCATDRFTKFITDGLLEGGRRFVACNHQRAIDYFTDDINHPCNYVGYACDSWKSYQNAECTDCGRDGRGCAYMGIQADHYAPLIKNGQSILMYLTTRAKDPFCYFQYRVTVHLHKGSGKYSDQKGSFSVTLKGIVNSLISDIGSTLTFEHGKKYDFILNTELELGDLQQLKLTFNAGINIFKTQEVYVEKVEVESMNYVDQPTRKKHSKTFCHKSSEAIPKNKETTLTNC